MRPCSGIGSTGGRRRSRVRRLRQRIFTAAQEQDWPRVRNLQNLGVDAAEIAYIASAVPLRIGVQDLPIKSRLGHAHAVGIALDRREIGDHQNEIARIFCTTQERKHARIGVIAIDPLKPVPVEIHLVKRGLVAVNAVQVGGKGLQPAMAVVLQQVPLQAGVRVPFAALVKYVHGNALLPRGDGPKIVCQLVNDRALHWGGGIARQTAKKYPDAEASFSKWMSALGRGALGAVHISDVEEMIAIASLVGQAGFGPSPTARIRYRALEKALITVSNEALERRASVHMPRIGTGDASWDASGDWSTIENIVQDTLVRKGVKVTVYDPPPKRSQLQLF